jgi:hypothetical protein
VIVGVAEVLATVVLVPVVVITVVNEGLPGDHPDVRTSRSSSSRLHPSMTHKLW